MIAGYWPFPATLGYKHKTIQGHGKVMVPHEPLASIIREILEGYANGRFQTQAEIARHLEQQPDFPNKTRYGTVTVETVSRLLNRVIYAGYVEVTKWNISLRKGQHEGLISYETYQQIQDRLHGKPKLAVRADIDEDFPLRGFVECGDCGHPMTACWSKSKTGKKHAYYMCHKKGCVSKGKSIRRADIEEAFDALLSNAQPSKTLTNLVTKMFKDAWEMVGESEALRKSSLKRDIVAADKKIENFLDRIVDANSASVISAYEKRIETLEKDKLVLQEQLESTKNTRPFNEMFELTMKFLSNPQKIWASGRLEHKRTVLKLVFAQRLQYCRKQGFRTPNFSRVFKALRENNSKESQMASEGVIF